MRPIHEYLDKYAIELMAGLVIVSAVGVISVVWSERNKINQVAKELTPYVQSADRKPGMSLEDKMDFGKRANLPEWMIKEIPEWGPDFSLSRYNLRQLETALKSYKNER